MATGGAGAGSVGAASSGGPTERTPLGEGVLVPRRVVSVSPRDTLQNAPMPAPQSRSSVFVTPRVLDQRAFDELAETLGSLLDDADASMERLRVLIAEARERAEAPKQASAQLQERLRLSARMLKAFQSQIDQVQTSIETLGDHRERVETAGRQLDERLGGFEGAAVETVTAAERRLADVVEAAMQRIKALIAARQEQFPKIDELERRLHEATDAAIERFQTHADEQQTTLAAARERLIEPQAEARTLVETLEATGTRAMGLARRVEDAVVEVDKRSAETRAVIEESVTAGRDLTELLTDGADRIGQLEARCASLGAAVEGVIEQAERTRQELDDRVALVVRAAEDIEPATDLCRHLEGLLERLEPWRKLLFEADRTADGLPGPVASMIEGLREGIGKDLATVSDTMREMAKRVEDLGLPQS